MGNEAKTKDKGKAERGKNEQQTMLNFAASKLTIRAEEKSIMQAGSFTLPNNKNHVDRSNVANM